MGYRTMMLWVGCALLSTAYTQPAIDWQHNYGGSLQDKGYSIAATTDGGYIILGETRSSDGVVQGYHGGLAYDLWVLKLDESGAIEWQRCLGGSGSETPGEIKQTPDGGYILVGSAASIDGDVSVALGGSDIWLVRLSAAGELLWERSYGGGNLDMGVQVAVLTNGNYLVGGVTFSTDGDASDNHGASDTWLGQVAEGGALIQSRCIGGTRFDHLRVMTENADGSVLFGGVTSSNDGDVSGNPTEWNEAWVVYLENGWDITWQTLLGGSGDDQTFGLIKGNDGHVFAAILSNSQNGGITEPWGDFDYWVVKLDAQGSLVNQRSLGGSAHDSPKALVRASDGESLFIAGWSSSADGMVSSPRGSSDCWLLKMTMDLELIQEYALGGSGSDDGNGLCTTPNGGLLIVGATNSSDGHVTGNYGLSDVWVVKLQPDDVGMGEAHVASPLRLYPNPATQLLNLVWEESATTLLVHDAQGRVVAAQERLPAGQRQLQLDVEAWADGLYTVQLMGADQRQVQRFAKH